MNARNITCLIIVFVFVFGSNVYGQDLENISAPSISASGNISIGSSILSSNSRNSSGDRMTYYIMANPTVSVYGVDIPISLSYRDQVGGFSISHPFNRLSINPRYKWVSVSAGKFNKSLSKYTLSNQLVTGASIDLTPGLLRMSAVVGSVVNPIAQLDSLIMDGNYSPVYKRKMWAAKLGIGKRRNYLDFVVLKVKDDVNSLDDEPNPDSSIHPEENLALGTNFKVAPAKWFSIEGDLTASAHTANQITSNLLENEQSANLQEVAGSNLTINYSTRLAFASGLKLDFRFKKVGLGFEYKRIDPNFKSLGSIYFQEDFQNFLGKLRLTQFKGKVRVSTRFGIQRNNLNGLRRNQSNRKIANISLAIMASKALSFNLRYANYQTERSDGLVSVNDTIRLARSTASYNFTPRLVFGSKEQQSQLVLSLNHQDLIDLLELDSNESNITNDVASVDYSLRINAKRVTLGVTIIGNRNLVRGEERTRVGINSRFVKKVKEGKLAFNIATGYYKNFLQGDSEGSSLTARVGSSYQIHEDLKVNTSLNFLNRSGVTGFREIRANIRMNYILPTVSTRSK